MSMAADCITSSDLGVSHAIMGTDYENKHVGQIQPSSASSVTSKSYNDEQDRSQAAIDPLSRVRISLNPSNTARQTDLLISKYFSVQTHNTEFLKICMPTPAKDLLMRHPGHPKGR